MFQLTSRIARCPSAKVLSISHSRPFSTSRVARRTVGIDLGTTNSCAAIMEGDQAIVIENDGKRTTPSIFAIDKDGNRLIGLPAQRQMVINPANTFFGVKRLIGRRYDDDEVKEYQKQVPYAIKRGPNGDAWVSDSNSKLYSPSEIASFILQKLKDVSEQSCGEEISSAVITVPAYFDNHQRQATQDAGVIAGFNVERIINEPTAAALAYGVLKDEEDKNIVVYDLGGGTFDVSILQIGGGVFEVKSTAGDTFLGGEDFNNLIANHVAKEFQQQHGVDFTSDKVALQRVREASELAKHDLSTRESVNIDLPYLVNGPNGALTCNVTISRKLFEELALPLVQKSLGPCQKALSDAGMSVEEVSDVIMVGGMTRMPLVRKLVSEFFKKEPSLSVNPDEAVAIGAALQGSIIANQGLIPGEEAKELVLVDVTPLNLGIKVHTGELAVIVPSQTPIPCRLSHTFTTAADFQTEIHTEVYQGNRPLARDNRLIGKYTMTGIPPAPQGVPKIQVTFEISANGTIKVTSMDEATKTEQNLIISMTGGLSPKDIERMKKEAEQHKADDEAKQDLAKLKNCLHRDIDHIKKGLTTHKNITTEQSNALNEAIKKAEGVLGSSTSKEELEKASTELKKVSGEIFSAAYNASSQTSQTSQT